MKKEAGTAEYPTKNSAGKIICRICGQSFKSQKTLEKHKQRNHTQQIKCKSCDKTSLNTCDLEMHIKEIYDSGKHLACDHCGKTKKSI